MDGAIAAFGALIAAWAIAEAALASPDRVARGTLALPTAIALLAGQLAAIAEHVARGGWGAGGGGGVALGAAVIAAGIALRAWAIATLGPAFRTALASDAPRRVTRGPYRIARHPSELGLVLIAAGGAILLASWLAAASLIVLAPLSVVRCRREDAALAAVR